MDVHVPAAVTAGLRRLGVRFVTAQEDGAGEFDDETLLARATELECVLFTQDDDLLAIAATWQGQSRAFTGILYSHQLRLGIGELVGELELVASCASGGEMRDQVTYLPLS